MAGLPLSLALPAAASTLAYLDARFQVSSDLQTLKRVIKLALAIKSAERRDRVNIFYVLESHAQNAKTTNRTFLVVPRDPTQPNKQTEWTYGEAYETILKYAAWLKNSYQVGRDDVVAMDFTNRPQFIWIWFALWSLGAKPAFINTNLRNKAFVHCVRIADSKFILVDPEIQDVLSEGSKAELALPDSNGRAIDAILVTEEVQRSILAGRVYRAPDEARENIKAADTGLLIYTSGTTGLPKAANVSWSKCSMSGVFVKDWLGLKASDRFLTAMPLYHSSASLLGLCTSILACIPFILLPKFSTSTYMQQATATKATVIQYVGEMCRYLVSSPSTQCDKTNTVRIAFGNGMRPDVWQKFKDRFDIGTIAEFYAATEAPVASWNISRNDFYRGAVGQSGLLLHLLFGSTTALVQVDHTTDMPLRDPKMGFCVRTPLNEPGELIAQLDPSNISDKFQGYYSNPSASSSKILRSVFVRDDAWYRTGDLMRRDDEGRMWFIDRIGDTFRWKGENVSTTEVSQVLGLHPALREANVYGVELPGHDGRTGCAAIMLVEGCVMDERLASELATHVNSALPKYAIPNFLRLVRRFEVTGTMKQTKVGLRDDGVDPGKIGEDLVYWLPPGGQRYLPFGRGEWHRLNGGSVKL